MGRAGDRLALGISFGSSENEIGKAQRKFLLENFGEEISLKLADNKIGCATGFRTVSDHFGPFSNNLGAFFDHFRTVSDHFRNVLGLFCEDRAGAITEQEKNLRAKTFGPQIFCESVSDDPARTNKRKDARKTEKNRFSSENFNDTSLCCLLYTSPSPRD